MSDVRTVARRVFLRRARYEPRAHVARSWTYLASVVSDGGSDDGQTIRELMKRRSARGLPAYLSQVEVA